MGAFYSHSICATCWDERQPTRKVGKRAGGIPGICCFCGRPNTDGIFVREDVALAPKCRCAEDKPETLKQLEAMAAMIAHKLNDELPMGFPVGWMLVMFDWGPEGFMTYASNAERQDMMRLLRELLQKFEVS